MFKLLPVLLVVLSVFQRTDGVGGPFGLGLQTSHNLPTQKPYSIRGLFHRGHPRNFLKMKAVLGQSPQELETPETGPAVQWGLEGEWKELVCAVRAEPEATFSWKLNGNDVEDREGSYGVTRPQKNWSVLRVLLTDKTKGEYTCRGQNSLGAAERNIRLDIAQPPPLPKFICDSIPDEESILCQVVNLTEAKRVWVDSFLDPTEMDRIKDSVAMDSFEGEDNSKPGQREVLPVEEYFLQIRIFRSCDPWRNLTSRENSILVRHLQRGLAYRVRMATKTAAGFGTFTRAKTVSHL